MANLDCFSARGINITAGLFLLALGLFFVVTGFTILPILGFVIAVPALILSFYFLSAPRDRTCLLFGKARADARRSQEDAA